MFFIVGSARSGTTMLRVIMNAHPEIAVPPESRFVVELYKGSDETEVTDFLDALEAHRRFRAWQVTREDVANEIGDRSTIPYRVGIKAAYAAYAHRRDKTRWGDKTPRYIEHIPLLARLFPEARFIHMVRDGRDVALSYAHVPFGPRTVAQAAALWSKRVAGGIAAGRKLGAERYLEIRYEDFVASPETQLKEICDLIGVAYEPAMLEYGDEIADDVLPRAASYNPNVVRRPAPRSSTWEAAMPNRDVEVFEAIAGDVLAELGYPRRFPIPRLSARVIGRLSAKGVPFGRLGRSRSPR